ncbi:hypothetical protein OXX69_000470 [Metschnikowia pulcherrima]
MCTGHVTECYCLAKNVAVSKCKQHLRRALRHCFGHETIALVFTKSRKKVVISNKMKRPDDFELFHQRRKRPALAEISNDQNKARNTKLHNREKPGLQPGHRPIGQRQSKHGIQESFGFGSSRNKNGLNTLKKAEISNSLKEFGISSAFKTNNKENIRPLGGVALTRPSKSLNSTIPELSKADTELDPFQNVTANSKDGKVGQSGSYANGLIGRFLSENSHLSVHKSLSKYNPRNSNAGVSSISGNSSARYELLSSLVDYNATVEKSNRAIRSFCDSRKLSDSLHIGSSLSKTRKNDHTTEILKKNDRVVELHQVTKLSPMLLAAKTSSGQDIVLMNTHGVDVAAGSQISLGKYFAYDLNGRTIRAYYKWCVL